MRSGQWRLASTLVVCSVAGMATLFAGKSYAAAECLPGPKENTPQGKHWYYRIEHPSKRHCWYLADEGRQTSQSPNSQSSTTSERAEPAPRDNPTPAKREPLKPAVANARAELTNDIAVPFTTMPSFTQQAVADSRPQDLAPPPDARFAERWPDAQPSTRIAQADSTAPPAETSTPPQPATIQPTRPQQTISPAASDDTSEMLRILLGIITAAIALAAIIGRLILTHRRPRKRPVPRRLIWQTLDTTDAAPVYARAHVHNSALRARAESDVEELLRALRYPEQQVTSPTGSEGRAQRPKGRSGARA
ncbi:MAG: hypothetical protein NTZ72_06775 [Afipia sp.]|nr:hypothetical protein [Afipia sp.]